MMIYEYNLRENNTKISEDFRRAHDMGFRMIHLLPFFETGPSHSLYAQSGRVMLDEESFVSHTEEDRWKELSEIVRIAHGCDMKIIFDAVLNHLANESEITAQHRSWFKIIGNNFVHQYDDVSQLRYLYEGQANTELIDWQITRMNRLFEIGFDGFRADMAGGDRSCCLEFYHFALAPAIQE